MALLSTKHLPSRPCASVSRSPGSYSLRQHSLCVFPPTQRRGLGTVLRDCQVLLPQERLAGRKVRPCGWWWVEGLEGERLVRARLGAQEVASS